MNASILFWLSSFSLFWLLITSLVLIRNRYSLTQLSSSKNQHSSGQKISVCIPARNEEAVLERLLQSVCIQKYPDFEVIVLDDNSDDNTPQIIDEYKKSFPGIITRLKGKPKPKGWLGKPWACHQLSEEAGGNILLFLDADTCISPGMLAGIDFEISDKQLDMITVWPDQHLTGFWQQTVLPLIYYALVTLLPSVYVYRDPRWMPTIFAKKFSPLFAAACGQCIGFTKEAYKKTGGHAAVKSAVVEDVELAKLAKKKLQKLRMYTGRGSISCTMYNSAQEMFSGFRKNFLAGFGNSLPLFFSAAILHLIVFVLPFFAVVHAWLTLDRPLFFMAASSVTLILFHRLILAIWFSWNPIYALTHPLGVLWFQWLGLVKITDHLSGRKVLWKGRKV